MTSYFDFAAATPLDDSVLTAMQPFFNTQFYNPSALYTPAVEVSKAVAAARADIAALLGAKPIEIVFTSGGTEANNLAIHGVMQQYPEANLVISAIEHDSVRMPAQAHTVREISVSEQGLVDPELVVEAIDDQTVLVSIMYANNEVGTVQPIRQIAAELAKLRTQRQKQGNKLPLLFHVDAAQASNYLDLHVHRLGVDLMTINGGKVYGPKQTGLLFVRSGVTIRPLIAGGGQERGLRSGTENIPGIIGLAAALKLAVEKRHEETKRLQTLQQYFIAELQKALPHVIINGSLKQRLPNNVHITVPGTDNERVLMALDMHGIYAAAGSACSASNDEPSHVLQAIGYDTSHIQSSLRFSMGRSTTQENIDHLLRTLPEVL